MGAKVDQGLIKIINHVKVIEGMQKNNQKHANDMKKNK